MAAKRSSKAKKVSQKPKPAIRKAKASTTTKTSARNTKSTTRKAGAKLAVAKAQRKVTPARKKPAPKSVGSTAARSRAVGSAFLARKKPETLRLRSAGPSFTVADIQQSLKFYCDALGFVAKERWEQEGVLLGVELAAGKASFWIGQDDWKKGRDRVKGQGFRIYCTTTQDVDALAARVKASGATLLEEPKDQPWGGRDFSVADPDGFVITIASGQ